MSASSKPNQFIFKAKTSAGFAFKVVAEYLSNLLKWPPFEVNEKGIFVRGMDQQGEVLVDVGMPRGNFTVFKCAKPIYFSVNAAHFYRLLKTIKKKDTICLFINEQRPLQLGISVEQGDVNHIPVATFIQINYQQPISIDLPDGYEQSIVETSQRFQTLKLLQPIGPEMKTTIIDNRCITFFVNGKNLFSREIPLGEQIEDDEENLPSYTLTYTTNHITQLTKCAGQSGNIQMFHHEDLPLLIKMEVTSLASMAIYIKSNELIEALENDHEDTEQDNNAVEETNETKDQAEDDSTGNDEKEVEADEEDVVDEAEEEEAEEEVVEEVDEEEDVAEADEDAVEEAENVEEVDEEEVVDEDNQEISDEETA